MVSDQFNLSGKSALVTGDGRFWSKYVAAALAEAGADVAIAALDPQKLKEAAGEVKRFGRKAVTIPTDVTNSAQVAKMVQQAIAKLGKIDILVNTSDPQFIKPFVETTEDEWHRIMDAITTSTFLCCQAVGKHMLERKYGRIINITSCLAERGLINCGAYCAATGAVPALTRALSLEWARDGITINAIGAGWFSEKDSLGLDQEDLLLRFLPLKRYGHPSEIGSLVVYLSSDAAGYYSGQMVYADGAVMAHA